MGDCDMYDRRAHGRRMGRGEMGQEGGTGGLGVRCSCSKLKLKQRGRDVDDRWLGQANRARGGQ